MFYISNYFGPHDLEASLIYPIRKSHFSLSKIQFMQSARIPTEVPQARSWHAWEKAISQFQRNLLARTGLEYL